MQKMIHHQHSPTQYYWEPHTSSIDFCEDNYLHSNYIVEIHNVWSSLMGISLFGILGLIYHSKNEIYKEKRSLLAYWILVLIGMGSAGLHGSLHWIFQSSDELPMIYFTAITNYMLLEHDSSPHQRQYPTLPYILTVFMMMITIIYYKFQHLYSVFLAIYFTSLGYYILRTYRIIFLQRRGGDVCLQLCKTSVFFYFGSSILWMIDMFACDVLLHTIFNRWLGGMTLHVLWHFGAGYAAYLNVLYLEYLRLYKLCEHERVDIRYLLFGFLVPYLYATLDDEDEKED